MFYIFLVTFREGVEAFLIAAIAVTYLMQTGQVKLVKVAFAAVATALLLSAGLGVALVNSSEVFGQLEGFLALTAAVLVISCVVHILRHGKQMASDIRHQVDRAGGSSFGAALALFGFILLMIGREGVEAATMIASLVVSERGAERLLPGALLGLLAAGALAMLWIKFGRRINLDLFFRVTAVFMVVFAVQLGVLAVHEFAEHDQLPFFDNMLLHDATEDFGPDGVYGQWLSYALLLIPGFFLVQGMRRSQALPKV